MHFLLFIPENKVEKHSIKRLKNIKIPLSANKKLIEVSVLRQATSQMMIPYTIRLAENILNKTNDKMIIFCAFDKLVNPYKNSPIAMVQALKFFILFLIFSPTNDNFCIILLYHK